MSLFGPAMAQAKRAFLNKITRSISFNSVFKNGGLKTYKRQGSVFLKIHDFKSQTAILILKANRDFTKHLNCVFKNHFLKPQNQTGHMPQNCPSNHIPPL